MPIDAAESRQPGPCLETAERPRHPYEIADHRRVRHQHASIKLNYGSLYSVIGLLEKQQLIEEQATVRDGKRPERTIYSITAKGRREATDWLSELLSSPVKEFLGFEAGLSLIAALPPDEVAGLLRTRLAQLDVQLKIMAGQRSANREIELPRLFVIETEYVYSLLDAERRFVADVITDIETGTFEGLAQWREWSR